MDHRENSFYATVSLMKCFACKNLLSQERILGGAAVLAFMQIGASLMGLFRDRILAQTFPGLDTVDIYIASFRPSDLLFQMCIMAGFSVALVPLLASYHADGKREDMQTLLSSIITIAASVFGILALILALALPQIAPLLVGFEGASLQTYVQFARLALISNFLFVFGNAFGQYLITIQRYVFYGITPILYTLGTILGTLYLTPLYGAFGPMYGTLGGAIVYVILRFLAVWHASGGSLFRRPVFHPDLVQCAHLMWPRMAALGALQVQFLLFDTVASGLEAGSITINAYARNFQSVAVGVAGVALAQSAYSLLSQAAAKKEKTRYIIYLRRGTFMLLGITIPGAIALVSLSNVAANLVSLTHVLPTFTGCLALYAVSIPFESVNHLLLRAFYATKHTITPAIISVLNGLIAISVAWMLAPTFGVYSLAAGFAFGQIVQLLGLGITLPLRIRKAL